MKVFIDTNVILDVLCKREKFYNDSLNVLKLCEANIIKGYLSALSITNIIYIMRKELNNEKIYDIINTLSSIFKIVDLTEKDIHCASILDFDDFEDAVQTAQAQKVRSDYIITRNLNDYINCDVNVITPNNFINYIVDEKGLS